MEVSMNDDDEKMVISPRQLRARTTRLLTVIACVCLLAGAVLNQLLDQYVAAAIILLVFGTLFIIRVLEQTQESRDMNAFALIPAAACISMFFTAIVFWIALKTK
jgi:hypothetical protein